MRKRARKIAIGLGLLVAALVAGVVAVQPDLPASQIASWKAWIEGDAVIRPRTSGPGRL